MVHFAFTPSFWSRHFDGCSVKSSVRKGVLIAFPFAHDEFLIIDNTIFNKFFLIMKVFSHDKK